MDDACPDMPEEEYDYVRGTGLFSSSRSYLGRDHLLSVRQFFSSETYRRFFFKDIQAIIVRPTNWGYFMSVLNGLLALFFLVLMLVTIGNANPSLGAFTVIMLVYFVLMTVRSVVRGPTCNVTIRTALQSERVPSFQYLRRTEVALQEVTERIEAVQGRLQREELFGQEEVSESAPETPTEEAAE